jgi:hypothetical protein
MTINQLSRSGYSKEAESKPIAYFQTVCKAFQVAAQATGIIERFYRIGGYTVCLRFAGFALVSYITPALAHLEITPTNTPALTVHLWDSASTLSIMPPPPWQGDDHLAHGEIRGYSDNRICTAFNQESKVFNMIDITQNLGIFWVRDATELPYYESAAPLRVILHWWMKQHNRQFLHGAAIGIKEGGVLLVGKGGSGKSTTALSCLDSELVYAGDDYCLLAAESNPYAYSLYNSAKLNADNIQRLPHLAPLIRNAERLGEEKAVFLLHEHYPEKIVSGFPIKAVFLPRVTGQKQTNLNAASAAEGLIALAPSTIFQLPGATSSGSSSFQAMAKLVKQVPCYILELGTDIAKIPDVILRFLLEG